MKQELRTIQVLTRFSPAEFEVIKKFTQKNALNRSEFLRQCVGEKIPELKTLLNKRP